MDATLRHLQWDRTFPWDALELPVQPPGPPPGHPPDPPREPGRRDAWVLRATGWRAGRPGTAALARLVAEAPRPVTWEAMQAAQVELGLQGAFRSGVAHCRDREYGWRPGLEARFARKVALDARHPPVVAAVRLYLDIIHVHPFEDGNTRAAVLWSTWTLAGAGWPVPDMEAVVRVPKPPGEDAVVRTLVTLLLRSRAGAVARDLH